MRDSIGENDVVRCETVAMRTMSGARETAVQPDEFLPNPQEVHANSESVLECLGHPRYDP
jgi:hypothetical protein